MSRKFKYFEIKRNARRINFVLNYLHVKIDLHIFIGHSRHITYNIDIGPCLKARTLAMAVIVI